ncbi:hypothetical protein A2215_00715 [Candidatus Berkelbacteria bacterium RIFOXYA2_FULL_43_10]|uniref:Uncharacterized protein n=1 Tax=Candidatus Berkelbacteria bacterium RIFOXYA2_FULL_43_10 TaxID=1797472 RepID=A0A1F5E563_9BACT|nr:MAG: hypothetical protein A2215_00715 [Candidatus Berkelbacteria bacterium RIFOXYA2_FULL_43_10]
MLRGESEINPNEYLQRNLEPVAQSAESASNEYAKALRGYPIGVDDEQIPTDSGEAVIGNYRFSYEFTEINPSDFLLDNKASISEMMESSTDRPTPEQSRILRYRFLLGDYNIDNPNRAKILSTYSIEHENNSLSVDELLPNGYRIVCVPELKGGGLLDADGKFILVSKEVFNFETIMELLHEIGHAVVFESLDRAEREEALTDQARFVDAMVSGGEIDEDTLARCLNGERSAWAFALKKIKVLLGHSEKLLEGVSVLDTIKDFIHQDAMRQNSDTIRKMMDPKFKGFIQEALERRDATKDNNHEDR